MGDRDPRPRYYWQSIGADGQVSRFLPAARSPLLLFYPSLQMTWKNVEEDEEEEEKEEEEERKKGRKEKEEEEKR